MTRSLIHSFIHSRAAPRASFFKRVRILKRARCVYIRALVVMCHVCICKKKRASRSSFSAAARRSSPRRKPAGKKLFENGKRTDRLFVSKVRTALIPASVNAPNSQSVTVCKFDRAPYRVGKRRSFGCVDLRLRDGRWTAARLDAGRARRLDPDRGSARPWRIRARRAPTRRRRDSALSSNAVPSGAPTGDPVFSSDTS